MNWLTLVNPAWLLVGCLFVLIFGPRIVDLWFPNRWLYLSRRKRRAVRLALKAFAADYPRSRVPRTGCFVKKAGAGKCVAFVQPAWPDQMLPAVYCVYGVRDDRDQVHRLGQWSFHWGITPEDAVEQYEKSQGAWPDEGG